MNAVAPLKLMIVDDSNIMRRKIERSHQCARLNFVGSATLAENHLELLGADDLQAKVKAQPTQRLRQLFQDLAQNQRFRRDVFVRGHAQLNRAGIVRNMENQVFGALRDLKNVTNVAKVARGEVKFDEKAFPALKEALQQGTWSIAELRKEMGRLVVQTSAQVTGGILTTDQQTKLAEDAARQLAA